MNNQKIAVFPLGIVVFPSEQLNLHIFEERYQQLIQDCETEGINFGIPAVLGSRLQELGTEVRLVEVAKKYDDGKSDIKTNGLRRFNIIEVEEGGQGKLYDIATVEFLEDIDDSDVLKNLDIIEKIDELFELLGIEKYFEHDPAIFRCFEVGHYIGLTKQQEFILLSFPSESERQDFILKHLNAIIPMVKQTNELQERVMMNGHFKHLQPPDFKP